MQEVKSRIPVLKPIRSAKQKQIDKLKDDTIDSSTSHKPTRSTDDLRNSTVNNTLKSNCSITPSDFDSLCNANYISEDGLESLKSDVSNVTNSGLNTLYHLEYYKSFGFHQKNGGLLRTTSSSSQLAEISSLSGDESIMSDDLVEHWDSLKEAFSGFEDCLRELAPESLESGLGLSPNFNADPCLLNKPIMEQYEHKMPSPPSDPKPSRSPTNQPKAAKRMEKLGINLDYDLRWSQASSGDDFENEGTSKSVVYENPNNRVEHQLYSLEGNCRSSFEMVYSPPVTAEQVVTQVKSASPVQNELVIQDFSLSAYEPISPQLRNLKGKYTSGSATPNSYEIRSVRSDESEDEDVHSSISSDYESPTKPNKTPTFGPRIPLPVHKSNSNGSENQPSTSLTTSISTIISSPTSNFASEPANSISKRLSLNVPQSPSDHSSLTAVPEKCVASPTNVPYYCQPPSNIQSDCRQAPSYTINANSLPTLTASLGKEIGGSNCDAFNNANSPVPALPIRTGSTVVIKTGCIAPSPTPRKPHSGGIYRRQNIEPSRNSVTNLTNSARSPIVSRNPMSVASQRYESRIQEQKGINYMSADEKSYDYEDDEDKEWNKKLEHIAKWQRDVHSALQDSQQNAFAPPVRLPVKCASFVKPSKDEEWSVDEWPVIKKVYAKGALGELEQLYDRINIEKQLENSPPTVQPVPRRSRISQKISTHSSPQLVQSTGGDNLPNEADKNEMQKPILDIEKKRQSFNQPTMISRPTQNKSISPFELPQRDDVANRGYGSNIRTTSFDPRTDHTDDSSTPYRIHNTPTVLSINPTSNHLQNRLQQSQSLNRGWNQPHEMRQNPPMQQHIPWRSNPVQFISNKSSKVHLGQPHSQPIPGAQPVINRMPRESANRVHSQSPISVAFSPGYAEALSLATAATDAVKEAVDRKSVHDARASTLGRLPPAYFANETAV